MEKLILEGELFPKITNVERAFPKVGRRKKHTHYVKIWNNNDFYIPVDENEVDYISGTRRDTRGILYIATEMKKKFTRFDVYEEKGVYKFRCS